MSYVACLRLEAFCLCHVNSCFVLLDTFCTATAMHEHHLIKSGNYDPSKSVSWKVPETVLSHLKPFLEV